MFDESCERHPYGECCASLGSLAIAEGHKMICECDEPAVRVESGLEAVPTSGTEIIPPDVVFARPATLNRHAGNRLRDRRCLHHVIIHEPAAKATASAHQMQGHSFRCYPEGLVQHPQCILRVLAW